tara:strand:- start:237 stop:686 length:450 start_codon:yes stop_codon:yes gene_type:complete
VPLIGVSQSIFHFDDSLNSQEKRFLEEVIVFLPKGPWKNIKTFNNGLRSVSINNTDTSNISMCYTWIPVIDDSASVYWHEYCFYYTYNNKMIFEQNNTRGLGMWKNGNETLYVERIRDNFLIIEDINGKGLVLTRIFLNKDLLHEEIKN